MSVITHIDDSSNQPEQEGEHQEWQSLKTQMFRHSDTQNNSVLRKKGKKETNLCA